MDDRRQRPSTRAREYCVGNHEGCYVTNISAGDYIRVRNVDFGRTGARSIMVRVASAFEGKIAVSIA
ncbi:MAG: carbohydrate-binding protein [Bacteroidaceae bacterium]|nr:carbohydrate-binding protein [Bacteroidaceae bacterium]